MNKMDEQKFKEVEERAQRAAWKTNAWLATTKRVASNCRSMQYSPRYAHLRDLNARGVHLDDPVYKKLDTFTRRHSNFRNDSNDYYVRDALCRIGNRTMTEEEYNLLNETPLERFKDIYLDKRFQTLIKQLDNCYGPNGEVYWAQGPFFAHNTPRNKEDPFHEAQELGYNRETSK